MTASTRLFYFANDEPGWMPVSHMVRLAARLLEAQQLDLAGPGPGWPGRLRATLLRPGRGGQGGDIYILRSPAELPLVFAHPQFAAPRRFRALWIIDSFWTDMLMRPVRHMLSKFDLVAYMRKGDGPEYQALCGARARFLGWGADVLDLGSGAAERPIDVLRIGRQPEAWDDDARTAAACAARGLTFHGRPPFPARAEGQQQALMADWYGQSKFVIAHSNLAAPAPYTHPTREYITARWTDAIACGATIAGAQPKSDLSLVSWPGAVLDTGAIDLERNLDQIAEALRGWSPARAAENHRQALRHLDWRWRLRDLARALDCGTPGLQAELTRLEARLSAAA
ncbi:hypothetical protein [Pseudogemmobacter faecipullorum]|uniref:Glycosyltransferase family 1 protein n=1 Tax=Pseudogemmobacter faecipullorum TaxID=2755041 RepID=A0ABS8CL25_9RHOB|nr:hypothetical protein [Pseudogemmobacter faecipullorum]MCB5410065.1 hypothetical protein [Pseudogemmobacter faecipullorum]